MIYLKLLVDLGDGGAVYWRHDWGVVADQVKEDVLDVVCASSLNLYTNCKWFQMYVCPLFMSQVVGFVISYVHCSPKPFVLWNQYCVFNCFKKVSSLYQVFMLYTIISHHSRKVLKNFLWYEQSKACWRIYYLWFYLLIWVVSYIDMVPQNLLMTIHYIAYYVWSEYLF